MKPFAIFAVPFAIGLAAVSAEAQKFAPADYQKALWMTTRFYGAQRQGKGPNWLLMDEQYPTSYMKDARDGRDLTGGWHDCGDFPLFGQTFFYSAYMLLLAYDAFPTGFPDLYHGFDYSDYAAAKDFTYKASIPDGIPDLLQEVKYATDWMIKATPDEKTFYFQKGNGGPNRDVPDMPYGEHAHWVTAGYYSAKFKSLDGGESDSSRPILKLGENRGLFREVVVNDGSMPSFAAASLAAMSRLYRKYDKAYADTCLAHARFAFALAKTQTKTGGSAFGNAQGQSQFYGANDKMDDDIVTAGTEMFRATGEQSFKDVATQKKDFKLNAGYTLAYSTNDDLAAYNMGKYLSMTDKWSALKSTYADRYKAAGTGENGLSSLGDGWGFLRYPANQAFVCGLYARAQSQSKATDSAAYDQFIYNQVDFILGGNTAKQSFVVGFCAGCTKSAAHPHHRNVYLDNSDKATGLMVIPDRNKEFGYMEGFNKSASDQLHDSTGNYTQTEGGIDYNAGLVGALAYINSKLNPVDTSKLGPTSIQARRTNMSPLSWHLEGTRGIRLESGSTILDAHLKSLDGRDLAMAPGTGHSVLLRTAHPGSYLAVVRTPEGISSQTVVVP